MDKASGDSVVELLCERLAGLREVFLPMTNEERESTLTEERCENTVEFKETSEKSTALKEYFNENPSGFLRRYHEYIRPKEISCFNSICHNEEMEFYVRKICHQRDLAFRTELDCHFISHEVKNRRYNALKKLIEEGEYFSEEEMEKRCPSLYNYYIGRYLTHEEREEKLREQSASQPASLSQFFMDVIEKKQQCEEADDEQEEEFDDDDEEEESGDCEPVVPEMERVQLAEEFKSRMYQRFLDGLDKNFDYECVDSNTEYDDAVQMERDAQDNYFDDEEPSEDIHEHDVYSHNKSDSEDELDKYMRTLA